MIKFASPIPCPACGNTEDEFTEAGSDGCPGLQLTCCAHCGTPYHIENGQSVPLTPEQRRSLRNMPGVSVLKQYHDRVVAKLWG